MSHNLLSSVYPFVREAHSFYRLYNGYLPPSLRPYTPVVLGAIGFLLVGNRTAKSFSNKKRKSCSIEKEEEEEKQSSVKKRRFDTSPCPSMDRSDVIQRKRENEMRLSKSLVTETEMQLKKTIRESSQDFKFQEGGEAFAAQNDRKVQSNLSDGSSKSHQVASDTEKEVENRHNKDEISIKTSGSLDGADKLQKKQRELEKKEDVFSNIEETTVESVNFPVSCNNEKDSAKSKSTKTKLHVEVNSRIPAHKDISVRQDNGGNRLQIDSAVLSSKPGLADDAKVMRTQNPRNKPFDQVYEWKNLEGCLESIKQKRLIQSHSKTCSSQGGKLITESCHEKRLIVDIKVLSCTTLTSANHADSSLRTDISNNNRRKPLEQSGNKATSKEQIIKRIEGDDEKEFSLTTNHNHQPISNNHELPKLLRNVPHWGTNSYSCSTLADICESNKHFLPILEDGEAPPSSLSRGKDLMENTISEEAFDFGSSNEYCFSCRLEHESPETCHDEGFLYI